MVRRSIAVLVLCMGVVFGMSALAQADTGNIVEPQLNPSTGGDGWQAGTCLTDEPVVGEPKIKCSPSTPGAFFKQAGGHPAVGFTQYIIQHTNGEFELPTPPFPAGTKVPLAPLKEPENDRLIKTLRVDLPPGLTVNPEATGAKCSLTDFRRKLEIPPGGGKFVQVPACSNATKVGREEVTLVTNVNGFEIELIKGVPASKVPVPKGFIVPPSAENGTNVPVFNLEPENGEPALFGFFIAGAEEILLKTEVSWENDFHESFTIVQPDPAPPFSTLVSRLINVGTTGNGTFISTPTTCFNHEEPAFEHLFSTWFRAHSFGEENPLFPTGSTPDEATLPTGTQSEGCENVPFDPSIKVDAGTTAVDSPSPATVTTEIPFEDPEEGGGVIAQSQLNRAEVTMPVGMGLNPSGSVGLVACTDAQFHKGERIENNSCPAASEIGTAEIETPVLPAGTLKGKIYVGEQKSNEPTSGEEFRILVEAKSKERGVVVRLIGHTRANTTTGQLTTVFDEQQVGPLAGKLPEGLPQVPFESVKLKFDGPHTVLTSPPTCATQTATSEMVPWSEPTSHKSPIAKFTLTSVPGGGACPQTLAARTFLPAYTAKADNTKGGAFSPFRVHIGRPDGQQEIKLVNVTLPKGLTGKLAGIPYCSETAINAARDRSGKAEAAASSCPAASMLGTTTTASGTGANPLQLGGKVFLAGPYKGAPISLAVITPAISGPFDLGTVVVRVALNVNPETAAINAVSDVIPDVFGGVKLDIRAIDFNLDRSKFMLNPTNCAAQATTGTINGGGADPANPAAFSAYAVNTPFQATACNKLGFKPKLHTSLTGPTKRAGNPRIRAVLEARGGDANIARTALTLPHSLFLDQSHIGTVCTRPNLAAHTCPKKSVYGQAEAISPLLENKLKGPVYLVPGGHELPDLVADLRGQVEIQLHGVISSKRGGLKTVFASVPDVPVSKFVLNMKGGDKSLLVNSTNTCKAPQLAVLKFKAQNGKKVTNNQYPLNIKSCGGKKKK
jgi:hypothetical protein